MFTERYNYAQSEEYNFYLQFEATLNLLKAKQITMEVITNMAYTEKGRWVFPSPPHFIPLPASVYAC